jgi:transcriptional regulator with XRE-family HTH domain
MAGKVKGGRPPDERRRRLAAGLRASGLSLAEVGRELGISKQAVHQLLRAALAIDLGYVRCASCGAAVAPLALRPRKPLPVLCPVCLKERPDTTAGQRLLSRRPAAGLSRPALAKRAGVDPGLIGQYEWGDVTPRAKPWHGWPGCWGRGSGEGAGPPGRGARPAAVRAPGFRPFFI